MANREKIVCFSCKKQINGPRTVIGGQWHCATCTYKIDVPDAELPHHDPRRAVSPPPGDETLFDTDSLVRGRDA